MEQIVNELGWLLYVLFVYAIVGFVTMWAGLHAYVAGRVGTKFPPDHRIKILTVGLVLMTIVYGVGRIFGLVSNPGPDILPMLLTIIAGSVCPYWFARLPIFSSLRSSLSQFDD